MEYRYLGNSGLRVSTICLGTMDFADGMDEATAVQVLDLARERKVNFIDTADAYSGGKAETLLGKLLKQDRAEWVLATKVGQQDGPPERKRGLSRRWIMEAIDASLKRLQTDYVDIYYMHHRDRDTPLAESVAAMGDVVRSGKATYWGFSNHHGWEIGEIIRLCDQLGTPRPVVSQPMYNLVMRQPENDHLPACAYYQIGVAAFSPLARGALTGKYVQGSPPPNDSRGARGDASVLNRDLTPAVYAVVEEIRKHVAARSMTPAEFATLWVLNNKTVTSVITGPRTLEHWQSYLNALNHKFTAEDEALVDKVVARGHPASPGLIWNRHPPMGRVPRTG
jgi:aryl-alcohol dehydrogenase-like predicted oxidoreductase